MGDFLDKELSKPIKEIDIDKINNYLNSMPDSENNELSKGEIRASFKLFKKRHMNNKKGSIFPIIIGKKIMAVAMILFAIVLLDIFSVAVADVSLFSKISSMFSNDEFTIIENDHIENNQINSKTENTLIDFDDLVKNNEGFEYLLPFKEYVDNAYCETMDSGLQYTIACSADSQSFHIRIFKAIDEETATKNFDYLMENEYEKTIINNISYYYNGNEIIYFDEKLCTYTFKRISLKNLTSILTNY